MLRKISSIMPSSSQLKSSSWLISVLIHVALIAVVSEVYTIKTNHKNDGLKAFEFVIYQPEPDKLSQKEISKDITEASPEVNSKTASKQSIVSKPSFISEAKITSQSKSVSEPKVLPLKISKKKPKTTPKPKPKPKPTIITKETVPTRNSNQETALTNASFRDLASKKPKYDDKNVKTDLDRMLSSQLEKPAQHNLRLVNASESKSPTKQMSVSLNKTLAATPDTLQIQNQIFKTKKSDDFGKINNNETLISDLSKNTPDTKAASINADLYNQNQSIITQTKSPTSTTELANRKKLLKNWAATIRNDIIKRTIELKLSGDVRISFQISRTGEILKIEAIGKSVTNESVKNFIDVIRTSGKFPMAPQGLKLDYVTFPVNFRSRG